jgi:hypothetical protein
MISYTHEGIGFFCLMGANVAERRLSNKQARVRGGIFALLERV